MNLNPMYFTFYQSNACSPIIHSIREKLSQLETVLQKTPDMQASMLVSLQAVEDKVTILLAKFEQPPPQDEFGVAYNGIMNQIDTLLSKQQAMDEYQYKSKPLAEKQLIVYKSQRKPAYFSNNNVDYEQAVQHRNSLLDLMSSHIKRCPAKDLLCVQYLCEKEDQYEWSCSFQVVESTCAEGAFLNEQMELVQANLIRVSSERTVKGCVLGRMS